MNRNDNIKYVILLLGLFNITDAAIQLSTTHDSLNVVFDSLQLADPIGCIYVDSTYLSRLSLDEIQNGNCFIDTLRLIKKLGRENTFRIAVIIEGYSGDVLIRKTQASIFTRLNGDYSYFGETNMENNLQSFVYQRFTELRQIRVEIKNSKALWKADLTSVFMLSDENRAKLCGFRAPQYEINDIQHKPQNFGLQLPPYLDWTNKEGINWVTNVKDQGAAGTCWAFATVGQIEALINIETNIPNPNFNLAEQTLVSDCCRYCGNCNGGMNWWGLMYVRNNGIPLESVDPYTARNGPCCTRPSKLWKIRSYRCITWQSNNENDIKNALQYHPQSTAVYVDAGWYAYTGGIYSYTGASHDPQHAILFVGWNDNDEGGTQTWKIKNSWGEDWGENGYMRLIRGQNNRCGWYTFDAEYEP